MYHDIVEAQRNYFESGATLNAAFRRQQLQKLHTILWDNEKKILDAIWADMHVNAFEAWGLQAGLLQNEIKYILRHLDKWMKPEKRKTPLFHFNARSYIYKQPYGVSLVIGPWNFPFMLALRPALGAMAAGNTCIIKPSEITAHTAALTEELINNNFAPEYLTVINTNAEGTQKLLEEKFDFTFFTGGTRIGKIVYEAAAKNLTPVSLELGGKSPCVVDEDVNLEIAAKRISWGKFMNAGQICVTPDYCLVHKNIKDKFVSEIIQNIKTSFGDDAQKSNDYGRIVNTAHTERVKKLIDGQHILYGGRTDIGDRYIEPTVIEIKDLSSPIMQEEIFGPVLPIILYDNIDEAIAVIKRNPDPLVLYAYTNDRRLVHKLMTEVRAGDMCVNENVLHFGHLHLPIGGVGSSGIGKYQGRSSFEEFSHKKSVLDKKFFPDLAFRYPPYTESKLKQLKFFLKNFWG